MIVTLDKAGVQKAIDLARRKELVIGPGLAMKAREHGIDLTGVMLSRPLPPA